MPSDAVGVNVRRYFIVCAPVLATRMSDSKRALAPSACATAGMIKDSGIGLFPGFGVTGVTRLTEIGTETLPASSGIRPPVTLALVRFIVIVALLVPTARSGVAAVTVKSTPSGPSVPELGLTVSQGLSTVAVNVTGGVEPATCRVCTTVLVPYAPTAAALLSDVLPGKTTIDPVPENGPNPAPQLLFERTR